MVHDLLRLTYLEFNIFSQVSSLRAKPWRCWFSILTYHKNFSNLQPANGILELNSWIRNIQSHLNMKNLLHTKLSGWNIEWFCCCTKPSCLLRKALRKQPVLVFILSHSQWYWFSSDNQHKEIGTKLLHSCKSTIKHI